MPVADLDDELPLPRCPECGCDLETDEHAFDCSYGDDEAEEDGDDRDEDRE